MRVNTLEAPDGCTIQYRKDESADGDVHYIDVLDQDGNFLAGTCSCNGVSRSCPAGYSADCVCTTRPPTLRCRKTT